MPNKDRGLVLVTGAAGFVGHHMVAEAVKAGFKVRATDVSSRHYGAMFEALGVEFIQSNLTQKNGLDELLKDIKSVIHIAGIHDYSTPDKVIFAVNAGGVENICAAAIKEGVDRFIHFSAAGVHGYNSNPGNEVKEDDPKQTQPLNNYFISKWEGEKIIHKYIQEKGLRATIFRPGGIYGPRSEYGLFLVFRHIYNNRHKNAIPIPGKGDTIERGSHVNDLCRAVIYAFDHDEMIGEAYFHSDESNMTTVDFFNLVSRELLGKEKKIIHIPIPIMRNIARVTGLYAKLTKTTPLFEKASLDYALYDKRWDGSKLRAAGFKFKYPTMDEGIKETIKWYKDNGWFKV